MRWPFLRQSVVTDGWHQQEWFLHKHYTPRGSSHPPFSSLHLPGPQGRARVQSLGGRGHECPVHRQECARAGRDGGDAKSGRARSRYSGETWLTAARRTRRTRGQRAHLLHPHELSVSTGSCRHCGRRLRGDGASRKLFKVAGRAVADLSGEGHGTPATAVDRGLPGRSPGLVFAWLKARRAHRDAARGHRAGGRRGRR